MAAMAACRAGDHDEHDLKVIIKRADYGKNKTALLSGSRRWFLCQIKKLKEQKYRESNLFAVRPKAYHARPPLPAALVRYR